MTYLFHLFPCFSKPSLSSLVVEYSFVKMLFSEVWPANLRKIEFCISQLVQKKVADPVFAAGSYHQFGIRKTASNKVLLQSILVDILNSQLSFFLLYEQCSLQHSIIPTGHYSLKP